MWTVLFRENKTLTVTQFKRNHLLQNGFLRYRIIFPLKVRPKKYLRSMWVCIAAFWNIFLNACNFIFFLSTGFFLLHFQKDFAFHVFWETWLHYSGDTPRLTWSIRVMLAAVKKTSKFQWLNMVEAYFSLTSSPRWGLFGWWVAFLHVVIQGSRLFHLMALPFQSLPSRWG